MKTSELIQLLENHMGIHGDTYVSIRHATEHEFSPTDDLTDISVKYDKSRNLLVLHVQN